MKQDLIEIGGLLLCAGMFLAANGADNTQPLTGNWELATGPAAKMYA